MTTETEIKREDFPFLFYFVTRQMKKEDRKVVWHVNAHYKMKNTKAQDTLIQFNKKEFPV